MYTYNKFLEYRHAATGMSLVTAEDLLLLCRGDEVLATFETANCTGEEILKEADRQLEIIRVGQPG